MSKATATLRNNNATVTSFRNWVIAFHALLTTVGLTQTTDTGQIDTATVALPAANSDAGYSIWRLNDTAQTTAPMFFKFRFGTGNNVAGGDSRLLFNVGEGSDGAGNLTGATIADNVLFNYVNSYNANQSIDVSINWNPTNGYFGMFTSNFYLVSANGYSTFSAERLRTITGTPSTRGFAVVRGFGGSPNYWTFTPGAWSVDPGINSIPAFWPGAYTGAASAGGTFISGLTPLTGDGTFGPLEKTLGFCLCGSNDFTSNSSFSITRWDGATHSYLTAATTGSANVGTSGVNGTYARHAIWWE